MKKEIYRASGDEKNKVYGSDPQAEQEPASWRCISQNVAHMDAILRRVEPALPVSNYMPIDTVRYCAAIPAV